MARPIEPDDDARDRRRPGGPSSRETRRRLAEEGDFESIMHLIRSTPWSMISVGEHLQDLMTACRAGARRDPERFARDLLVEMVAFNAYLTLRMHLFVGERVVGRGPMPCKPTLDDFAPDTVERLLPRLMEMQRGMAEVLHAQAATTRLQALARAKEAQAGRPAATDREGPRRDGPAAGKAARSGRNPAAASTEGADEAVVSLPVRGRRRG